MSRFLLHFAPRTRAVGSLWLLEEAGAGYDLHELDITGGTQKSPDFLALNPAGKLPVLEDRGPGGDWTGTVICEAAAIVAYVADALPEAGLAPAPGTRDRAAYQFWMTYGPGVAEPAMADLAWPRAKEAEPVAIGWPPFPAVQDRIEAALGGRDWLLGPRFSAADITVGGLLAFMNTFGMLQPGPNIARYLAAIAARPARQAALRKGGMA
ncbi:glutathione S-transferase family protein [Pararoseomonas sp. SCSIO 73927]|uniref:glutathione S-transferase family protein n=1 Tax=Pararoseomonas sp. SCSIO 73927 TaxID=3114537 RepID=UPI0030CA92D5